MSTLGMILWTLAAVLLVVGLFRKMRRQDPGRGDDGSDSGPGAGEATPRKKEDEGGCCG